MKILITGVIAFVVWGVFSSWLYVEKISPSMRSPATVQAMPEQPAEAPAAPVAVAPEDMKIYFGFDRSQFTPDQQTDNSVADIKSWLEKNPSSTLLVTGHADERGTERYNQALGLRRAESIQKYLSGKGIPGEKIVTESKGETQPASDNSTDEGRTKNRRGEISIKNKNTGK